MAESTNTGGIQKLAPFLFPALSFVIAVGGIIWAFSARFAELGTSIDLMSGRIAALEQTVASASQAQTADRAQTVALQTRITAAERDIVNFGNIVAQFDRRAERTEDKIDQLRSLLTRDRASLNQP